MSDFHSWNGIVSYIFSVEDVFNSEVLYGFRSNSITLLLSLLKVLQAITFLLLYLVLVSSKVSILAFPYIYFIVGSIIEFHQTQLTYKDLFIELLFISGCILYVTFRKSIHSAYTRTIMFISSKSQAAARVAPHFLFLSSTVSICILFQKFLIPLTSTKTLPIFTVLLPLCNTIRLYYYSATDIIRYSHYKQLISLWTILSLYYTISTGCSMIPFSHFVLNRTVFIRSFVCVVSMWIQANASFTDIVFDVVQPIKQFAAGIPSLQVQPSQSIFTTLQSIGILRPQQALFLISLFQDGMALIFAILFIFTPFPTIGVIIVSLLFPAFKSARSIESITEDDYLNVRTYKSTTSKSFKSDSTDSVALSQFQNQIIESKSSVQKTRQYFTLSWKKDDDDIELKNLERKLETLNNARMERSRWIEYWICFAVLFLFSTYICKIWPSFTALVCLWLQHSYFQGATKTLRGFISLARQFVCVINDRNQRLKEEINSRQMSATKFNESKDNVKSLGPNLTSLSETPINLIDRNLANEGKDCVEKANEILQ